jgi:hypothetical protein
MSKKSARHWWMNFLTYWCETGQLKIRRQFHQQSINTFFQKSCHLTNSLTYRIGPKIICTHITVRYVLLWMTICTISDNLLGGYSQNFLRKFVKISITLGLNILRFYRPEVFFTANISRVWCLYYKGNKISIFYV